MQDKHDDWHNIEFMRKAEGDRLVSLRKCLGRFRGDGDVRLSREMIGSLNRIQRWTDLGLVPQRKIYTEFPSLERHVTKHRWK